MPIDPMAVDAAIRRAGGQVKNNADFNSRIKISGDDDVFSSPISPIMRGWQWKALKKDENANLNSWMPRLMPNEFTPLTETLASPGKQSFSTALVAAPLAAGSATVLVPLPDRPEPVLLWVAASAALAGGAYGYSKRRKKNDEVIDALRQLPPGAVMRDLWEMKDMEEGNKIAAEEQKKPRSPLKDGAALRSWRHGYRRRSRRTARRPAHANEHNELQASSGRLAGARTTYLNPLESLSKIHYSPSHGVVGGVAGALGGGALGGLAGYEGAKADNFIAEEERQNAERDEQALHEMMAMHGRKTAEDAAPRRSRTWGSTLCSAALSAPAWASAACSKSAHGQAINSEHLGLLAYPAVGALGGAELGTCCRKLAANRAPLAPCTPPVQANPRASPSTTTRTQTRAVNPHGVPCQNT